MCVMKLKPQVRSLPHSLDHSLSKPQFFPSFLNSPVAPKSARARSSIPILQTQSAESKAEFGEIKDASNALKARIQSLRAYKTALLQHHLDRQSSLLTNETELMRLKLTSHRSTPPPHPSKTDDTHDRLTHHIRLLREIRTKHTREVSLFKRSAGDLLPRSSLDGHTVLSIVRNQLELYETQLVAKSEEEREAERRYLDALGKAKGEKMELRRQLEEGQRARMRELAAVTVLRRKEKMLGDAIKLRSQPKHTPDNTHQSAQALLNNLKLRLTSPSPI